MEKEMKSIGFIEDKNGDKYEVKYRKRNANDWEKYYFRVFSSVPNQSPGWDDGSVASFEFNVYDDEDYANIEDAVVDQKFQNNGIYKSFLFFIKDFFKTHGLKGIFSEGIHRNNNSNSVWDKMQGAKKIITPKDEFGNSYSNYTLEHLKTFSVFEKENKYTVYDNSKGGKFWGDKGAGILIICKTTKRLLVAMRSEEVNEPNTWGIFGGKMDNKETPKEAAKRELIEETGYKGNFELIPAYVFESPNKDFTYYNFIGIVEKEFKPKHFGLKKLLIESKDLILKYIKN